MRLSTAFACATSLGLFSTSNAFVPSTCRNVFGRTRSKTVVRGADGGWDNDSFLDSLKGGNDAAPEPEGGGESTMSRSGDDESFGGGSRFKAMMQQKPIQPGQQRQGGPPQGQPGGAPEPPKPHAYEHGDPGYDDIPIVTRKMTAEQADAEAKAEADRAAAVRSRMFAAPQQQQQQPQQPPPPPAQPQAAYPPPPPPQQQPVAQQPVAQQPVAQQPLFDANGNPVAPPPPPPVYYDQYGNPVQGPPVYYDQYGRPIPPPPPVQYDEYGNPVAAAPLPPPPPPPQQQFAAPPPQQGAVAAPAGGPAVLPPPPPKVPMGQGARNPDANKIVNKSDVYLAQLKRDSTVRVMAWEKGDLEGANRAWEDEGIKELDKLLPENPYKDKEEHQWAMVGTSREDELPQKGFDKPEERIQPSGPNYKERLAQMKAKKSGGGAAPVPAAAVPAPAAPAPAEPEVVQPEPVDVEAAPVAPVAPVAEAAKPEPVQAAAAAAPPAPAAASAAPADQDEIRRDIRTLMGLVLKHRGGPGFGSGILKAPEATRLKGLLGDVSALLRSEAGMSAGSAAAVAETAAAPVVAVAPAAPAAAASSEVPAALSGAIACVEGAVKMYKDASAAEQEDILPSLRSALLSAVNTCNKVIAEAEVEAAAKSEPKQQQQEAAPVTMGFPSSYAVTVPEEQEEEMVAPEPVTEPIGETTVSAGDDPNTAQLRQLYDKLKASAGDGKFGLNDLSANEIASLGDALADMRGVLMEELDTGIPDAPEAEVDSSDSASSSGSGGSKYQQMLAKSKAEKAAKKKE